MRISPPPLPLSFLLMMTSFDPVRFLSFIPRYAKCYAISFPYTFLFIHVLTGQIAYKYSGPQSFSSLPPPLLLRSFSLSHSPDFSLGGCRARWGFCWCGSTSGKDRCDGRLGGVLTTNTLPCSYGPDYFSGLLTRGVDVFRLWYSI